MSLSRSREFLLAAEQAKRNYEATLKLVESTIKCEQWERAENYRLRAISHFESFLDNMIASYKETSLAKKK